MKINVIFWNIDTQIDFVMSHGKLPVPDAEKIIPSLKRLTEIAKENDIVVVNTCDWHNENTKEISESPDFINTFPEHCMENTSGACFITETNPENPYTINHGNETPYVPTMLEHRNIIIRKDKFDVFTGNGSTEKVLNALKPKRVIVYGVAENVCVNHAVIGLLKRGKEVYVVEEAIKGLPGIESPIERWKDDGAKIISLEEIDSIIKEQQEV